MPRPAPAPTRPDTARRDPHKRLSLTLFGTGGSAAVPDIACTTDPAHGCKCCLDTLAHPTTSPNIRANTGAVIRVPLQGGDERCVVSPALLLARVLERTTLTPTSSRRTILVDCGKTFRELALKFFPAHGLRKIDACILTRALSSLSLSSASLRFGAVADGDDLSLADHHADAVDGLDDLRAWTYKSAIEKTIPIYCTKVTYLQIASTFPYMVSKSAASGGGAVPSFEWHLMPDDADWTVCGVTITPVPVHHGVWFTTPPSPLVCLGFLVDSSVLYISDTRCVRRSCSPCVRRSCSPCALSSSPPLMGLNDVRTVSSPRRNGPASQSTSRSPRPRARSPRPPRPRPLPLAPAPRPSLASKPSSSTPAAPCASRRRTLACRRPSRPRAASAPRGPTSPTSGTASRTARGSRRAAPCRRASTRARRAPKGGSSAAPSARRRGECATRGEQQAPAAHVYEGLDPHGHVEDVELLVDRALEAVEEWAGAALPDKEGLWVRPGFDGLTLEWESPGARGTGGTRVWDSEYEYE